MKRPAFSRFAAVAAAVFLVACQGLPVDFTGYTVTDRSQIDPYKGQRLTAEASGFQLLLFIPFNINDRHQRAFEQLRREAGNRLLADVTVTESWQWAFVGTVYTTRIDATAYPRKAAEPAK
jgi:hypothetical protein